MMGQGEEAVHLKAFGLVSLLSKCLLIFIVLASDIVVGGVITEKDVCPASPDMLNTIKFFNKCNVILAVALLDKGEHVLRNQPGIIEIDLSQITIDDIPDSLAWHLSFDAVFIHRSDAPADQPFTCPLLVERLFAAFGGSTAQEVNIQDVRIADPAQIAPRPPTRCPLRTTLVCFWNTHPDSIKWMFDTVFTNLDQWGLVLRIHDLPGLESLAFLNTCKIATLHGLLLENLANLACISCNLLQRGLVHDFLSFRDTPKLAPSPATMESLARHRWGYLTVPMSLWMQLNLASDGSVVVKKLFITEVPRGSLILPETGPNSSTTLLQLEIPFHEVFIGHLEIQNMLIWASNGFSVLEKINIPSLVNIGVDSKLEKTYFSLNELPRLKHLHINGVVCKVGSMAALISDYLPLDKYRVPSELAQKQALIVRAVERAIQTDQPETRPEFCCMVNMCPSNPNKLTNNRDKRLIYLVDKTVQIVCVYCFKLQAGKVEPTDSVWPPSCASPVATPS
ncbi:hypothetical protein NEDG_00904 [Nematocida displodere]|uniref:Uncharacterized protein n=1 Tax=Nematocida displodere TaxID=1805483 RepID=A0A177EE59_9MICR|nr:hypothetical protein NEDG_00904 [Nematocida displodere]